LVNWDLLEFSGAPSAPATRICQGVFITHTAENPYRGTFAWSIIPINVLAPAIVRRLHVDDPGFDDAPYSATRSHTSYRDIDRRYTRPGDVIGGNIPLDSPDAPHISADIEFAQAGRGGRIYPWPHDHLQCESIYGDAVLVVEEDFIENENATWDLTIEFTDGSRLGPIALRPDGTPVEPGGRGR